VGEPTRDIRDQFLNYSLTENRILKPASAYPNLDLENYDGTQAIPLELGKNLLSVTNVNSAATDFIGTYSALTSTPSITDFVINRDIVLKTGYTTSGNVDGTKTIFSAFLYAQTPRRDRSLMVMRYVTPHGGSIVHGYDDLDAQNSAPFAQLTYRQTNKENNWPQLNLERNQPDFNTGSYRTWLLKYPFGSDSDNWYSSGTSEYSKVWKINIVRTSTEIGDQRLDNGTGYTAYASREYNGQKQLFGLDQNQRQVGFVYHEDNYTGKTYGEL